MFHVQGRAWPGTGQDLSHVQQGNCIVSQLSTRQAVDFYVPIARPEAGRRTLCSHDPKVSREVLAVLKNSSIQLEKF